MEERKYGPQMSLKRICYKISLLQVSRLLWTLAVPFQKSGLFAQGSSFKVPLKGATFPLLVRSVLNVHSFSVDEDKPHFRHIIDMIFA
jgi:hypothetical protein